MIATHRPNFRYCQLIFYCILAMAICACDTNDREAPRKEAGYSQTHNWERAQVIPVETSGLTIPFVVAKQDPDYNVHMAYYSGVTAPDDYQYQRLNYVMWNPRTNNTTSRVVENRPAPTGVQGFDSCDQFDLALDDTTPVLIYPTYEVHPTNLQFEADIMVNLYEGGNWAEATAAVGFVERNPVFQDGHATENMSLAVDSQGNVHAAYQFFYEGIDAANANYPDIFYVFRDRETLHDPLTLDDYSAIEEQIEGNYFGTYGVHNSVGYACELILDPEEQPVVIYGRGDRLFDGVFALRAAFRDPAGQWHVETVAHLEEGWTVGAISAAYYPPDPEADPEDPEVERPLAVAYALRSPEPEPDNSHRLMFAVKREGEWDIQIVDETTWCGGHCSLAFTPDGFPAIAYSDEQSHSGRFHHYLKYAEFNGVLWMRESAEEEALVGAHNSLWFDEQGVPNICTYSEENSEIMVIRQID